MRLFHLLLVLSLHFLISCERKTSSSENPPQLLPAASTGEDANRRQNAPVSEPILAPGVQPDTKTTLRQFSGSSSQCDGLSRYTDPTQL